jgi:hypothetical protein
MFVLSTFVRKNALLFWRDILVQYEVYCGTLRYLIFYFLEVGIILLRFGTRGKLEGNSRLHFVQFI